MMEFTDAKFMTAEQKKTVLAYWDNFLKHGCDYQFFRDGLYRHLINHCGFKIHYSKAELFDTYFSDGWNILKFLEQFNHQGKIPVSIETGNDSWYFDPEYSDLNQAMCRVYGEYKPGIESRIKSGTWRFRLGFTPWLQTK